MRKTVEIDDELKVQIDRLREERGESMKQIVNQALRRGLRVIEEQKRRQNK